MTTLKKSFTPLLLFGLSSLMMGMYAGLYDPSFNNYLAHVHNVSEVARGGLEFPRELPGFLVVFLFTALVFLADTRIAAFSALLVSLALWGQGFLAPNMAAVVVWMLIWSTGAHLFMSVSPAIGLRLSTSGEEGRRLGQLGSLESLGTLLGIVIVYWGASRFHFSFATIFAISGTCALIASIGLFLIKPQPIRKPSRHLVIKKRYTLFYLLNIVFGARKQIFMTFAPWVLIKVYQADVATFAVLGFIGTVLNLVFRPWLGRVIDAWGERTIIMLESLTLIIICGLYAFAEMWFPARIAVIIIMACYITDQLLFSVRIARTTYLHKIVETPDDLGATLSMGLSMDHAVSMLIPLGGGILWARYGYISVFLVAACLAVVNLWLATFIPIRQKNHSELA
ncbi:MAG TPA: MFS transporter [Syntrophomonas sp.]|nr:MFS transporter [Syntrophomonas sp.]